MSWPRKNEGERLYFDRSDGSYLAMDAAIDPTAGGYDAIGNVFPGPKPSLASCLCTPGYLLSHCRRVSWDELPPEWQEAFRAWYNVPPESIRGFWRMGQQPNR